MKSHAVKGEAEDNKEPAQLISTIRELDAKIESHMKNIRDYDRQIEDAKNQIDEFAESEDELSKLSEDYESEKHRYDIVCITKELITKAKENLGARYVNPMESTFIKFYEQIEPNVAAKDDSKFVIDANGNIGKYEQGLIRDIRQLSFGNKDLINFCMRLAMVDSMYEREKPMLILDDPFVNLDSNRYERALGFLQKLSENYQILYFTCRELS